MSDKRFFDKYYAVTLETFCSFPVPADPFSLLLPVEDDKDDEEDTIDEMLNDEIFALEDLNDILFELIDRDINGFSAELCPLTVCPRVGNVFHCTQPAAEPSPITTTFASNTGDKQPLHVVPLSIAVAPPTKLPEWLVNAEAFDDPTHQLCSIKVQDYTAKRMELLYLHVGEKLAETENTKTMQNATKAHADSASKVRNENMPPKVPPQVVKPPQQTAMKSSGENSLNTAKESTVTLVSEKLRNHLHKLSKINVPVLGNTLQSSSNVYKKSRRKQTLISRENIDESMEVQPTVIASTKVSIRLPAGSSITLKNSTPSEETIASTSSSGTNFQQNIERSPKKKLRNSKRIIKNNYLLTKNRR